MVFNRFGKVTQPGSDDQAAIHRSPELFIRDTPPVSGFSVEKGF